MIEELKEKTGIKTATGIFDLALLALYNEQKNGIKQKTGYTIRPNA